MGWGKITEGQAPEWTWDEASRKPLPSPDHKRGFSVMLKIKDKGWRDGLRMELGMGLSELWQVVGLGKGE